MRAARIDRAFFPATVCHGRPNPLTDPFAEGRVCGAAQSPPRGCRAVVVTEERQKGVWTVRFRAAESSANSGRLVRPTDALVGRRRGRLSSSTVPSASICFHLLACAGWSARPKRRRSALSALASASVFCVNCVPRRGDGEQEIWRRNPGAVSAEGAIIGQVCERSLCSGPEAETVGQGGGDSRPKANKRATPGVDPLGVAC